MNHRLRGPHEQQAIPPSMPGGSLSFRAGFSLLELVIAIAIMLTIMAISVPIIQGVIADRSFDTATGAVLDQLQLARSHAQLTGEPTMVVYSDDPARLEVRQLHNDDDDEAMLATEDDLMRDPDEDDVAGTLVVTAFAVRHLAAGIQMQPTRPETAMERFENWTDDGERSSAEFASVGAGDPFGDARLSFTLVVYLPDGSALPGAAIWMVDPEWRTAKIVIDPFTGQSQLERIEEAPAESDADLDGDVDAERPSRSADRGATAAPGDGE